MIPPNTTHRCRIAGGCRSHRQAAEMRSQALFVLGNRHKVIE